MKKLNEDTVTHIIMITIGLAFTAMLLTSCTTKSGERLINNQLEKTKANNDSIAHFNTVARTYAIPTKYWLRSFNGILYEFNDKVNAYAIGDTVTIMTYIIGKDLSYTMIKGYTESSYPDTTVVFVNYVVEFKRINKKQSI